MSSSSRLNAESLVDETTLNTQLLQAANTGNVNEVQRLLALFRENKLDFTASPDQHFYTPLLSAVRAYLDLYYKEELYPDRAKDYRKIIELLLEDSTFVKSVNETDGHRCSALYYALHSITDGTISDIGRNAARALAVLLRRNQAECIPSHPLCLSTLHNIVDTEVERVEREKELFLQRGQTLPTVRVPFKSLLSPAQRRALKKMREQLEAEDANENEDENPADEKKSSTTTLNNKQKRQRKKIENQQKKDLHHFKQSFNQSEIKEESEESKRVREKLKQLFTELEPENKKSHTHEMSTFYKILKFIETMMVLMKNSPTSPETLAQLRILCEHLNIPEIYNIQSIEKLILLKTLEFAAHLLVYSYHEIEKLKSFHTHANDLISAICRTILPGDALHFLEAIQPGLRLIAAHYFAQQRSKNKTNDLIDELALLYDQFPDMARDFYTHFASIACAKTAFSILNLDNSVKETIESDLTIAKIRHGVCLLHGIGLEKDEKEAFTKFQKHSAHPMAAFQLAKCYLEGKGTERDEKIGMQHLLNAIQHDIPAAHEYYASAWHQNRKSTLFNLTQAKKSAEYLAKTQKSMIGNFILGEIFSLNPNTLSNALHHFAVSVVQGYSKAELSQAKLMKIMNISNPHETFRLLLSAAGKGSLEAYYQVAWDHYNKGDYIIAFKWFYLGMEKNHLRSKLMLAEMLRLGLGIKPDAELAFTLVKFSAKTDSANNALCLRILGDYYRYGTGTRQNPDAAFHSYKKAFDVQADDHETLFRLAESYKFGIGVKADENEARKLFTKSAQLGNKRALTFLNQTNSSTLSTDEKSAAETEINKLKNLLRNEKDEAVIVKLNLNLAYLCRRINNPKEFISYLLDAINTSIKNILLFPGDKVATIKDLLHAKYHKQIQKNKEKPLKQTPPDTSKVFKRAQELIAAKKYQDAEQLYVSLLLTNITELNNDSIALRPDIYIKLVQLYLASNQPEQALDSLILGFFLHKPPYPFELYLAEQQVALSLNKLTTACAQQFRLYAHPSMKEKKSDTSIDEFNNSFSQQLYERSKALVETNLVDAMNFLRAAINFYPNLDAYVSLIILLQKQENYAEAHLYLNYAARIKDSAPRLRALQEKNAAHLKEEIDEKSLGIPISKNKELLSTEELYHVALQIHQESSLQAIEFLHEISKKRGYFKLVEIELLKKILLARKERDEHYLYKISFCVFYQEFLDSNPNKETAASHAAFGGRAHGRNDYVTAIRYFDLALDECPHDEDIRIHRIECWLKIKDPISLDKAKEEICLLLTEKPTDAFLLLLFAQYFEQAGDWPQALNYADQALQNTNKNDAIGMIRDIMIYFIDPYSQITNLAEAADTYLKTYKQTKDTIFLQIANLLLSIAIKRADSIICEHHRKRRDIFVTLGNVQDALRDHDVILNAEAKSANTDLEKYNADFAKQLQEQGNVFCEMKNHANAESFFKASLMILEKLPVNDTYTKAMIEIHQQLVIIFRVQLKFKEANFHLQQTRKPKAEEKQPADEKRSQVASLPPGTVLFTPVRETTNTDAVIVREKLESGSP